MWTSRAQEAIDLQEKNETERDKRDGIPYMSASTVYRWRQALLLQRWAGLRYGTLPADPASCPPRGRA
jgi:hypothetical protein